MERAATDESLKAFIDAECARRGIAAAAWRSEAEHWRAVAGQLRDQRDAFEAALKKSPKPRGVQDPLNVAKQVAR